MKNRYAIIAALSALIYLPSVFGGFMWDDEDIITGDGVIHGQASPVRVFSPEYWKRDFPGAESRYRPMRSLLLMAQWRAFGSSPAGYHAVNLLLNSLASCLALWLAWLLLKDPDKAFAAALIFALHPVHVESVAWLKNVTDILMFIFSVLAAGAVLRSREGAGGKSPAPLAAALFLLALFSKENAVMLPALLFSALWLLKGEPPGVALRRTLPLWIMSAVFLAFAVFFLRREPASGPFDIAQSLLGFAQYSRLLFLPLGLNADRSVVTLVDAAGPLALAALAFYGWRKGNRTALYSSVWAALCLVPFIDARFTTGRPIAEQRLYMAALGAGLAFASFYTPSRPWNYALSAFAIVFGTAAAARVFDWIDPVRLWEKTVASSPASARAHNNLGVSYERAGRLNDAAREYSVSMALAPSESHPQLNIADLLYRTGDREKAEKIYTEALSRFPGLYRAKLGLMRIKLETGRPAEALFLGRELLGEKPGDAEVYNAIGVANVGVGRREEALAAFRRSAELAPGNTGALYNIASLYRDSGELRLAAQAYEEVLRADPAHADALNNLAILSDMDGNEDGAIRLFRRALEVSPGFYQAAYNLGGIYFRRKMYVEALSEYSRVLAAEPGHEGAAKKSAEIRKLLNEDSRK